MTQVPILNGIFTDSTPAYRTSYPRNLVPHPKNTNISKGFLSPADGVTEFSETAGIDRGGINWNGLMYRVAGSNLVSISEAGSVVIIGGVETDGANTPVKMVYSFDYLAVASNGKLWLYDGVTLLQNTDGDLGTVLDVIFIDGYFMTTDGENLVVTELNDPFAVNPLKYGSSEVDPDPVVGLEELRNEVYAINTNTIEVFSNIGGSGFPFRRIDGAQIEKGAIHSRAATVMVDAIAFVGNGRNEALGVYLGVSGQTQKISSAEIDERLEAYSSAQLEMLVVEDRIDRGHQFLYLHFHDQTFVFDRTATGEAQGALVWFTLDSGSFEVARYRARGFVKIYGNWLSGDPTSFKIGQMVENISSHFDDVVYWQFSTVIMFNANKGGIIHEMELTALTGAVPLGADNKISTQWSSDGITWSQPRYASAGNRGDRGRRIRWFKQGRMIQQRIQRFSGTSNAHVTISRLEVNTEALAW